MNRIVLSCDQDMHRLAAYQFLEPWLRDARVLEVGCGAGHGLRQIFALGARAVVGLDRDTQGARARVAALEEVVRLGTFQPPRLGLGRERFDVAIVSDASLLGQTPAMLEELRSSVAPDGLVVVRAESRDRVGARRGSTYAELMDLLEPLFAVVRVFGQSPFVGYSVAELTGEEEEDLDLFVDGALLGGAVEEVASYLVLCGEAATRHLHGAYGILQVPAEGDTALERWWDSLAAMEGSGDAGEDEERAEDSDLSEGGSEKAPAQEPTTASPAAPPPAPVPTAAVPAPGPMAAAPAPARAPMGGTDLLPYTDGRGGRVTRWRWPSPR